MELKPCPVWNEGGLTYFGGPRANDAWYETEVGTLRILCEDCPNRRPIEDALAARVTELEAENKRTREALAGATDELERLSDIICPEDVDLVEQVLIPARAALEPR